MTCPYGGGKPDDADVRLLDPAMVNQYPLYHLEVLLHLSLHKAPNTSDVEKKKYDTLAPYQWRQVRSRKTRTCVSL